MIKCRYKEHWSGKRKKIDAQLPYQIDVYIDFSEEVQDDKPMITVIIISG